MLYSYKLIQALAEEMKQLQDENEVVYGCTIQKELGRPSGVTIYTTKSTNHYVIHCGKYIEFTHCE